MIAAEWPSSRQRCSPAGESGTAHPNVLSGFHELVAELGGDTNDLFAEAAINPAMVHRAGYGVDYNVFASLLATAARRLGAPDFGLRLAMKQRAAQIFGPVEVVMRNAGTVGEAVSNLARYAHAYSPATRLNVCHDGLEPMLELELLLEQSHDQRQAAEHLLLLMHLKLRDLSGGVATADRVDLRHEPLSVIATYRDYFGCDVRCERFREGLAFTTAVAECSVLDADAQLLEMAFVFLEQRYPPSLPPVHARVRSLVLQHLATPNCTYERIAAHIHMHPRTLQRRLREEGCSFEAIKDDVRRSLALRYLQETDLALVQVAAMLGYTDASVLSRSCFRWFDTSPLRLRQAWRRRAA